MKNYCIFLLVYLFANNLLAQTLTIKDKESGLPLEMVTIYSQPTSLFITTNVQGKADISGFKNSSEIVIRSLAYKTEVFSYDELAAKNFQLFLESTNLNLSEVVISGTGWRQSSDHIPAKISSISPKQISLQSPQTAADLLSISGKVFIQKSQQGGGSPMIRGFATNRLLYTVDGVRMNTAIFRGGNIQNVINLDPFTLNSVEVFFGPGSVIYGSDAIGGVMSFQTLSPQFSLGDSSLISGKAITRYSSANKEKTFHVDVQVGKNKWAFLSSISRWDYDDLRQGTNGPSDYLKTTHVETHDGIDRVVNQSDAFLQVLSGYNQLNLMQKVAFKPSKNWLFEYGYHFSKTSEYGRYDRHNRIKNGVPRYAEWNYGPQIWAMNNLHIQHQSASKLYDEFDLRLSQQNFEESRIDRSFNSSVRSTQTENVQAYAINLGFKKSLPKQHTLFYGAEYVLNKVSSKGVEKDIQTIKEKNSAARYPNSDWASFGIYLNDEYQLNEKINLQAGLRYSEYKMKSNFENNLPFYPFDFRESTINNNAVTGSLGAIYRPDGKWVISSNIGTAYRSPNVDDIGKVFDSEPGTITVPNPNLKAEYAYNMDLGFAKVFGESLKIDVTGFNTILKNALVRRNFQLNGKDSLIYQNEMSQIQAIQNAATATVYGVQAGIEVKLTAGFSFSTDLNYQVGIEELDNGEKSASQHAAPFFGTSRLSYKVKKFNLMVYSNYQAERGFYQLAQGEKSKDEIYAKDSQGNNYAPSWMTWNIKTMLDLGQSVELNAGIENLMDLRYRPYGSGISASGRNYSLMLRVNF